MFFFVGRGGRFRVFFMVICGSEEEIEFFEGFFISGLKWMTRGMTVVFLQEVSANIAGVQLRRRTRLVLPR